MSVMMDIIFSVVVGGVIVLIILNANSMLRNTWSQYDNDLLVQQALVINAQIIEFRNMGYGVDPESTTIVEAKDTSIQFKMAVTPGSSPTLIKYYSGSISELTNTPNPKDRFLYRQEGAKTPERVGMITQFKLGYLTKQGDTIPTPVVNPADLKNIKMVEITMEVQTPMATVQDKRYQADGTPDLYSTALWKQTRLASQNLKR
jgi:hypothetical protein